MSTNQPSTKRDAGGQKAEKAEKSKGQPSQKPKAPAGGKSKPGGK